MARSAQRAFWSLQSRTWDQPLATESARRSVDEVVAILAAHVTGGVIVDVGCGTGNHAHALAASGLDIIGVDFAAGMLERARRKVGAAAGWVQADLHSVWPLADERVDALLSVFVLQFFAPEPFLAKVSAALRPGAVALIVWPRADAPRLRPPAGASLRYRLAACAKRLSVIVGTRAGVARTHTRDDVEAAAVAVGLDVVDTKLLERSHALLVKRPASRYS